MAGSGSRLQERSTFPALSLPGSRSVHPVQGISSQLRVIDPDRFTDPTPTRLRIVSALETVPGDASLVRLTLRAALEPGVRSDGSPRRVTDDVLRVGGTAYAPSQVEAPSGRIPPRSGPTWLVTESFSSPGPEGIRLDLPQMAGLGPAQSIGMRLRDVARVLGHVDLSIGLLPVAPLLHYLPRDGNPFELEAEHLTGPLGRAR